MLLCDAHAHLGNDTEWEERTGKGILSLICATGPEEAGKLFSRLEWLKGRAVIPTAGLHPWYADQYTVQDMEPYIRRCPVVGEIGMDSVWCQVPLPIQERVFREQLAMACSLALTASAEEAVVTAADPDLTGSTIILHTNDVHGGIAGYAQVSALKQYYQKCGAYVLLFDAGDFIQGDPTVSASQGTTAIELMNLAGYDAAALGNHEFD